MATAWKRRSAVLFVALALVLVMKTPRLFGYDLGTDSRILAELSAELAKEERFQNLTLMVEDRLVKLRGTVPVLEDMRQAVRKAAAAKGVKIVVSHIKVATARIDDNLLRKQLSDRLAEEENTGITLKVKKGVVTIRGFVQHDGQRERILSSVASVPGVIGMDDRLRLIVN